MKTWESYLLLFLRTVQQKAPLDGKFVEFCSIHKKTQFRDCSSRHSMVAPSEGTYPLVSYSFFFFFLRPHLWHMDILRPGVKLELQQPAYATATAMLDPSHILDLHHNLWQCWILNPLSEGRDWIQILMDTLSGS